MSGPTITPARNPLLLPENVRLVLDRLAHKECVVGVLRFPLLVAIVLPLFWLLQSLVDLVFNLSWATRLGFLAASGGLVVWLFVRYAIIPFRRRMNGRSAALLVERSFPQFRTSLVSAVDFTSNADAIAPRSAPLVEILIGQVGRMVDQTDIVRGIVDTRPLKRLLGGALATVAAVAGLIWCFQPQSLVLVRRILLSHDAPPSRTTLQPLTEELTINTGSNVELAVRAQGVVPRNGRMVVAYADGRTEPIAVSASPAEPDIFRITLRNVLQSFHYHFEINDGTSPTYEVKTRTLPSLATTRFIYFPPSYTGRPETELPAGGLALLAGSKLVIEGEATQPLQTAVLELKGLDRSMRADSGDALANLRIRIETNEAKLKELQTQMDGLRPEIATSETEEKSAQQAADEARKVLDATKDGDEKRKRGWEFEKAANLSREARSEAERLRGRSDQLKRELEGVQRQTDDQKKQFEQLRAEPPPDKETAAKQKRIVRAEIEIPKEGLNGVSLHLVNEEGLASENDPVYRVNITTDKPPIVEITEPKSDRKTVLGGDKVPVKFKVRDDYRIEKVSLRYVMLRPNADGEAVPVEEQTIPIPFPAGATNMASEYVIDLSTFLPALTEGSYLTYWIEGADHYTLYSPGAGTSRRMNLIVVSPEEKKAELIAEMEKAAKEIERLSERQRKTNEKTDANMRR